MKSQTEELVYCLTTRIRPPGHACAAEHNIVVFTKRHRFALAIDFAARSDEDIPAELVGDIQHDFCAANIGFYRMNRILSYQPDTDSGSQMKDHITVLHQRADQFGIADVAGDKLKAAMPFETFDVVQAARTEVVDDSYVMTVLEQPLRQMRTDKTRSACNQCFHVDSGRITFDSKNNRCWSIVNVEDMSVGGSSCLDSVPVGCAKNECSPAAISCFSAETIS
jgi:hypothetical protein